MSPSKPGKKRRSTEFEKNVESYQLMRLVEIFELEMLPLFVHFVYPTLDRSIISC
jgi:hypothetical protein